MGMVNTDFDFNLYNNLPKHSTELMYLINILAIGITWFIAVKITSIIGEK